MIENNKLLKRRKLFIWRVVALDLTQKQMAEKLGVTRSYYNQIERGLNDGGNAFWKSLQETFNLTNKEIRKYRELS